MNGQTETTRGQSISAPFTLEDVAIFARIEGTRTRLTYADGDAYDSAQCGSYRLLRPRGGPNMASRKRTYRQRLAADGWFRVTPRLPR